MLLLDDMASDLGVPLEDNIWNIRVDNTQQVAEHLFGWEEESLIDRHWKRHEGW